MRISYSLFRPLLVMLICYVKLCLEPLPPSQCAFLVWCYYPKTQGAKMIYAQVLKPYVVPALGLGEVAAKKQD
jgi:hypothetical protein